MLLVVGFAIGHISSFLLLCLLNIGNRNDLDLQANILRTQLESTQKELEYWEEKYRQLANEVNLIIAELKAQNILERGDCDGKGE
jgi:hypothetical protein